MGTSAEKDGRTGSVRRDVWFESGGVRCAAWLYVPAAEGGPRPLVVMAHGLGAVREWRLDAFAERFAAQGWMVLVFDYRYLGASEGSPRQLLDIGDQLDDWRAAVAYGRSLPEVDPDRIALWGTSFGGGHVLRVASEDHGVAAVVAQCPFTDGPASLFSRFRASPVSTVGLIIAAVLDVVGSVFGAKPVLAPVVGVWWMPAFLVSPTTIAEASRLMPAGSRLSPRTAGALARFPALGKGLSPTVETGGQPFRPGDTAVGRDTIWGVMRGSAGGGDSANAIAARLALRLPLYRPGKDIRKVAAATLLCVCDDDRAAPARTTARLAAGQDHVQVNHYDGDHFDVYVGDLFERAVADQVRFLAARFTAAAGR
ncbi:alpha/beta hydrolase [Saccharopolyspora dendranthemae]|uniref:Serine aminopeptidase S33 family n=1 Tax=Saccharopolyspora dendranthemae TaxID=1181886 RepID=A0A561V9Y5_9PSEU|nr:alpha/beta fold hydrolase [Saccharopolyspora dendranthemae]TWG08435.1 serine aminopeptidase S33 family [Saccharopolyspora dendranthemae]